MPSPNWIYLGHDSTQINPNGMTTGTTKDQAKVVENRTFPASEMQGVTVTGNATNSGGANFGRGIDQLSYSLSDGNGGSVAKTAVYTSHVVVNVTVSVAKDDPLRPGETIRDAVPLRGVIIQMANGDLFMRPYFDNVGTWDATLADWGVTRIDIVSVDNPDNAGSTDRGTNGLNASATFSPAFFEPGTFVPCFAAGTLILTDHGEVSVENLRIGDLVLTLDNGFRPIRWIGGQKADLVSAPRLAPIRIKAGALGNGTPDRDLLVSPQHRILVRSSIAQRMFGASEILVAAQQLLQIEGIDIVGDMPEVHYFHILFDRHEIVRSNGAETESLYTGSEAIKAVGAAAREEIFAIFPELQNDSFMPEPARTLASGRMGRTLAGRHAQNDRALVS